MKDLAVVGIEDGIVLGLRFRDDATLRVVDIVGSEAMDEPDAFSVHGFAESDLVIKLPSDDRLDDRSTEQERRIQMLPDRGCYSVQTADILLHQIRPNLRYNMVSPLAALAALQRDLGAGVSYLSKQSNIYLDDDSIRFGIDAVRSGDRSGYLCGAEASREISSSGSARLLRFEDLSIELDMAVRPELEGLGHLFALTVGAALHVVNTAASTHTK
jgi:hypothetical protein